MRKYNNKSNVCGEIIKKYRLSKNLSCEKLANKLQLEGTDVDKSYIYRIEKQVVILKDFELLAICKILDIDFDEIESLIVYDI